MKNINIEFKKITDLGERFIASYYNLFTTSLKKDKEIDDKATALAIGSLAQAQAIHNGYNIVSATINNEIIGIITYTPVLRGHSIKIDTLTVLPIHQRKGIGKALVNFVLNENKNKPINTSAFIDNEIAVTFWDRLSEFKRNTSNTSDCFCFSTKPKSNKPFVVVVPPKELIQRNMKALKLI